MNVGLKIVKHIAGILLAAVGVLFTLGSALLILEPDPEVPLWGLGPMVAVFGVIPLLGSFALLWRTLTAPGKACPQCGGRRGRAPVSLTARRNWLLSFLTGWLLASLWGASRQQQVQCLQCESVYVTDTRGSRIAGVLLWVFVAILAFGVIAEQSGW